MIYTDEGRVKDLVEKLKKGEITILEVKTNLSRVDNLVSKAYDILNRELPESHENCEYCKWNQEIIKF